MDGLAGVDRALIEERQHPLRPWLLAAGLLLVTLATAGVFYYSPLVGGVVTCPEGAEVVPAPETEEGVAARERCLLQPATVPAAVRLDVEIRNDGPLPISVTGVVLGTALADVLSVDLRDPAAHSAGEPFAPVTLSAGEATTLTLDAQVAGCSDRRAGRLLTLTDLPVRTRFLGVTTTAAVPLANELSVLVEACDR